MVLIQFVPPEDQMDTVLIPPPAKGHPLVTPVHCSTGSL